MDKNNIKTLLIYKHPELKKFVLEAKADDNLSSEPIEAWRFDRKKDAINTALEFSKSFNVLVIEIKPYL